MDINTRKQLDDEIARLEGQLVHLQPNSEDYNKIWTVVEKQAKIANEDDKAKLESEIEKLKIEFEREKLDSEANIEALKRGFESDKFDDEMVQKKKDQKAELFKYGAYLVVVIATTAASIWANNHAQQEAHKFESDGYTYTSKDYKWMNNKPAMTPHP